MKNHLFYMITRYLKEVRVIVDTEELKFQLLSHPSYPSLHSVTGVLNHFNIDNAALEVDNTNDVLSQCPNVFMTLIGVSGSKEYAIVKKHGSSIECILSTKNTLRLSTEEFLDKWSGIVVVIDEDNLPANNKEVHRFGSIFSFLSSISLIVLLGVFFYNQSSNFGIVHFILSLIGLIISVAIIRHELGFYSKAVEKFCSLNETTNCDAVLNSNGANFLGFFKLSDISLIYFSGLTVAWMISTYYGGIDLVLPIISFLTIPMIIYSLYYQNSVVKNWCTMCLGIIGVLVIQAILSIAFIDGILILDFNFSSVAIVFFSWLLTLSVWGLLKPLLKKQKEFEKLNVEHYKFKRNYGLFEAALNRNIKINTVIDAPEIILGNRNAPLQIVLVTNPMCGYCKGAHSDITSIIKKHPESVNAIIRFNVSINDTSNHSYKVSSTLLALQDILPFEKFIEELHYVYSSEFKIDSWLKKWSNIDSQIYNNILKQEQEWCHRHQINFTPALYINGQVFPKEYDRADLSYFIEELIECCSSDENAHIENNMIYQ